jgi:phosphate transport system permease protein
MLFRRLLLDTFTSTWMVAALATILFMPLLIGIGLYIKSATLLEHQNMWDLITSSAWQPTTGKFGFWPFISGSIYVTIIAFFIACPICLLSGIYLSEFSGTRLIRFMHPVIDILAGLPSVVYGVWGILVVVPFVSKYVAPFFNTSSSGYSILAGGIVLSIMCIPYMLNMILEVFKTIPIGLKEASLSLGSTHWETIKFVILKKGFPGIVSSFGLGIAKAFGETIAVLMVVGNQIQTSFNPFEAGYPLPALIANNYGEMLSIPMYDSALMFSAFLLLIIILIINLVFRYFIHKYERNL